MSQRRFHPDLHHRRSLRLPNHDYRSLALYLVTLCTAHRQPLFENPQLRQILEETWHALPARFPGVTLDEFVIMPEHLHGILRFDGSGRHPASLGEVIGAYKSLTTVAWLRHIKAAQLECPGRFWQRDYDGRILHDEHDLQRTRHYIRTNPTKQ